METYGPGTTPRMLTAASRHGRAGKENGTEFLGDECVHGAEASGKVCSGKPSLAMEPAQKVRSGVAPFQ
jgi:hypothetical protein